MEQWILDGRSLIRQRDPAAARPCAEAMTSLPNACSTSLLLCSDRCRVQPGSVEFRFDCDASGDASPDGAWCSATDLSGLSGFVRLQGEHQRVVAVYARVVVSCTWFYNGEVVDTSQGLEFVAGAGTVPQALEESVLGLDVGGVGVFLCDPAFAFREDGFARPSVRGKMVPPDAVVTLFVKLESFENPMHPARRVELATQLKQQGNEAIRLGDFKQAVIFYREALDRLSAGGAPEADVKLSAEERNRIDSDIKQLRPVLYHNMALCVMNMDPISADVAGQAVTYCTRALSIDPNYAKARYRRALAFTQKRDFHAAAEDAEYLRSRGQGEQRDVDALIARIAYERSGGALSIAAK